MLGGMEQAARKAATEVMSRLTPEGLKDSPRRDYQEPFYPQLIHVLVRFGRWEEILEMAAPEDVETMATTNAILLYARGLAYAALGKVPEAEAEEVLFLTAAASKTIQPRRMHNNVVIDLLAVHARVLSGEIAYRKGRFDQAFAELRAAVVLEDALPYDEPWGVMQPCRHALGALLLEQGYGARFPKGIDTGGTIGSHACSLEANMRVTNGIPLGCPLL
jgi:hypothetical protein